MTIAYAGAPLKEPVWVDLMSGRVYAFPKERIKVSGGEVVFSGVPVYDSPCLIAEKAILRLQP